VFTSLVFVVGVGGEDDTRLGGASSEGCVPFTPTLCELVPEAAVPPMNGGRGESFWTR